LIVKLRALLSSGFFFQALENFFGFCIRLDLSRPEGFTDFLMLFESTRGFGNYEDLYSDSLTTD
jgi:hypothetical protein